MAIKITEIVKQAQKVFFFNIRNLRLRREEFYKNKIIHEKWTYTSKDKFTRIKRKFFFFLLEKTCDFGIFKGVTYKKNK